MFITNAPIADLLLVFASTDKTKGFAGVSAFIAERGFPGFSVGKPLDMMGLRTSPIGEVLLEDCEVPAGNLLGKEGGAAAIFNPERGGGGGCRLADTRGA